MKLVNKKICPEDVVRVLLPAGSIPDGSIISKRTGTETFVLKHALPVYPYLPKENPDLKLITLEGFYLLGRRSVSQVAADTALHWHITAEDLIESLRSSWEVEQ